MQGCMRKYQRGWRMHSIKGGLAPSRKKEKREKARATLSSLHVTACFVDFNAKYASRLLPKESIA